MNLVQFYSSRLLLLKTTVDFCLIQFCYHFCSTKRRIKIVQQFLGDCCRGENTNFPIFLQFAICSIFSSRYIVGEYHRLYYWFSRKCHKLNKNFFKNWNFSVRYFLDPQLIINVNYFEYVFAI